MTDRDVERRLPRAGELRLQAGAGVRAGWARVRASWSMVLQACLAAGAAYGLARLLVGHDVAFFAPVAAWIALGFSRDRSVRRVAELAVGVAVGVALGDLVVRLIGSGVWQMSLVLLVAALVGRFIGRGPLLTTQAGVQAIVIVGLPVTAGTPVGRFVDALIGGGVALAVALLTPADPRRHPRTLAGAAVRELAGLLHRLARGLRTGDVEAVEGALLVGRASQPALDEWRESARSAADLVRLAPAHRRHRPGLERLVDESVLVDRAMRNARVLARRSRRLVAEGHDGSGLGEAVDAVAWATDELAIAIARGEDARAARDRLLAVARTLDPHALVPDDWEAQAMVLLLRSLVVDLLEASGAQPGAAREALPEL